MPLPARDRERDLAGALHPLIPDLVEHLGTRDADCNWFETAQLLLPALVVPLLAKLGDMHGHGQGHGHGHGRILLISTVLTATASWWLVVALEAGATIGALAAVRVFRALGGQVAPTLAVPAIAVSLVFSPCCSACRRRPLPSPGGGPTRSASHCSRTACCALPPG